MMQKRSPRRGQIHWQWVRDHGTGFFGYPKESRQYWQERDYAWFKMDSVINKVGDLGADRDFLRACALHLAELAAAYDRVQNTFRLSKGSKAILLDGTREGLKRVTRIQQKLNSLRKEWDEAKGMVSTNSPDLAGEKDIDKTFSNLDAQLGKYVHACRLDETPEGEMPGKDPGRPDHDDILLVLSGMDKYLHLTTKQLQRSLLCELTSGLLPRLPIVRTANQLRSAIHDYRKRRKRNGNDELKELRQEYKQMRKKFTLDIGVSNG